MASQAVSKHFVRENGLVDTTKPMALEKGTGARQRVDSWQAKLSCFVKASLEQTGADLATTQVLPHHERPHFGQIGKIDMKGDAPAHTVFVDISVVISDILVEFGKRARKQCAGGDLVVDERFQGGYFRDPRLTDDANVC